MRLVLPSFVAAISMVGLNLAAHAAPSQTERTMELARDLATKLSQICPHAITNPPNAFKSCADALKEANFIPFANDMEWGGDQSDLPIKKRHLTHLNPMVFQTMYLPLMAFTGKWRVVHDDRENVDIIKLEGYFRNELPAGEYPYPFWHSAAKWNAYETMNEVNFYVNHDGKIFVGTRGDSGSNQSRGPYTHVAHEPFQKDHWLWTDANGKPQPEVSLFANRYQATNPHLGRLDETYRAFASEMRKASCDGCHNPLNPADATNLTLLQTPNHAAGEMDRVIKVVESGEMPQDEFGLRKDIDPALRAAILRTAQIFRNEVANADAWEITNRPEPATAATTPGQPNSVTR